MFGFWKSLNIKSITFIIPLYCVSPSGKRWLPLVTHVTFACDLIQFNSIYGIELIKHIFKISLKAQLFGALKNQGGIT